MVIEKESFLSQKKREWEQVSLEYYQRFQEKENPEVIVEFVRFSLFALKEEWVVGAIIKLMLQGQHHSLKKIFSLKRGEKKSENQLAIRNILITEKVDRLVAQGVSKTKAFEDICSQKDGLASPSNINEDQIKKIYYATKKKKPQIYVCSHGDFFEVMIYPAKIAFMYDGQSLSAFGLLRMLIKNEIDSALKLGSFCENF